MVGEPAWQAPCWLALAAQARFCSSVPVSIQKLEPASSVLTVILEQPDQSVRFWFPPGNPLNFDDVGRGHRRDVISNKLHTYCEDRRA